MALTSDTKPNQWDFDGACAPTDGNLRSSQHTFSVGCFQWIPKASKKGLKRSRVMHRITGLTSNPEEVYEKARAYCAKMNAIEGLSGDAL